MLSHKMIYGCLCLLFVLTAHTWACGKREQEEKTTDGQSSAGSGSDKDATRPTVNACCHCGQAVSVTMLVSNQVQEPFFEYTTEVKGIPQRELIHLLEEASTQDKRFRFKSQHYGSLGYMITSLNELSASSEDKTYWQISSHPTGLEAPRGLPLGVSFYIPTHNEIVMFNLTSYATPDNH